MFTREDVTDEQRLLAQTAAEFMRLEVLPVEARLFAHDWALVRTLLEKAGTLDLLGVEVPEAFGGMALDKVSVALVAEQIAVHPSFSAALGVHSAIGTLPLVYFGTEEQKARYLPRMVRGELIGAYALTEPGSGSDARAVKTTATLSDDGRHYLLNGEKMWISNGGFADIFTIFAKVNGEQFTAFIVERAMGVVSGPEEKKLGLDGTSTTALRLDEVRVPVENVLGTVGEGHKVAFNVLNLGRVKLGARNMTSAREALRHAARYATDRRQFGQPIGEFGLIQEKLADMAIRCFVGDAVVFRTLGNIDEALSSVGHDDHAQALSAIEAFAAECSIVKVYTSEALAFIADEALQVFGGNGFSREFPVERIYRDARITRIYEGTNEINRLVIATRLLKRSQLEPNAPERLTLDPDGALSGERRALEVARGSTLALFRTAECAFGERLRDQQEVLARLANLAIDVYGMESALGRAVRVSSTRDSRAPVMAAMVEVHVAEALPRMVAAAAAIAARLAPAHAAAAESVVDALRAAAVGVDTIERRRSIARATLARGGDIG